MRILTRCSALIAVLLLAACDDGGTEPELYAGLLGLRDRVRGVSILVEDAADEETLAEMGLESPWELTGLYRGTPLTQAIMPLLTEHKVPLVAPSTGAMVLHKPVHPWLFNVRATYQREAERAMRRYVKQARH